ncbi:putative 115 kDa protein in type-1 retrotransposable element R1DM [Ceratocystis lukuohia]|uniref:115 kDa protein in type-1 retrotransposable element R1DM n=1 Tax=Ceratocystis lukuohia TaxID=2019550 RepID=A0ABR4ML47_9PEZI
MRNVPRNVHDVMGNGNGVKRTTLEDIRKDSQGAFSGELKILEFREYENETQVHSIRVAALNPERSLKTTNLLGNKRVREDEQSGTPVEKPATQA